MMVQGRLGLQSVPKSRLTHYQLSEVLDIPLVDLLPPQAAGRDLVIRDQQEILLIERFRSLTPPQREVYLRLLVVMREGDSP